MLEDHLKPRVALWAHIAVGVCLGILSATVVMATVAALMLRARESSAAETLQLSAEKLQREQATRAADERARTQQATEAQKEQEAARARRLEEAERRELAWTRYYRKPAPCDEAKGGTWSVDCANDYIRARARFSALYDSGKL